MEIVPDSNLFEHMVNDGRFVISYNEEYYMLNNMLINGIIQSVISTIMERVPNIINIRTHDTFVMVTTNERTYRVKYDYRVVGKRVITVKEAIKNGTLVKIPKYRIAIIDGDISLVVNKRVIFTTEINDKSLSLDDRVNTFDSLNSCVLVFNTIGSNRIKYLDGIYKIDKEKVWIN